MVTWNSDLLPALPVTLPSLKKRTTQTKRITFIEKDTRIKLKIGLAQETDSSWCLLNNPSPAVCIFLLIKAIWILWKEHIFFTKPIITLSCTKKASCSHNPRLKSRRADSFTAYFFWAIQHQEELLALPSHSLLLPLPLPFPAWWSSSLWTCQSNTGWTFFHFCLKAADAVHAHRQQALKTKLMMDDK